MNPRMPRPLTLFLLTAILAVVAVSVRFGFSAYRRSAAVKRISQFGALGEIRRVGPDWLRGFVGEDRMRGLDDYRRVEFLPNSDRFGRFGQSLSGWQSPLPTVGDVELSGLRFTDITDSGIEHVSCLQKLETLLLDGTDLSDAAVPRRKRLANLKELSLRDRHHTGGIT